MTAPPAADSVVVPSGAVLADAAQWVGHACWSELQFHQLLTDWLAVETDPELSTAFWAVRAHRGELAEAWHRRLPELREFPRSGFVRSSLAAEEGFATLDAIRGPADGGTRAEALRSALSAMAEHYRGHLAVAVGPADGPTADTLAQAIARTDHDLGLLQVSLSRT